MLNSLDCYSRNDEILGELQFSFICFLVGQNYDAFELTEENEHDLENVIDEDIVFRLPTAEEIADASRSVDRKISSTSSTCSTSSFQSSTYEG